MTAYAGPCVGPIAGGGLLSGVAGLLGAMQYALTHDPLTGLLSRIGLEAEWPDTPAAAALLDLNAFKAVNDTHGHAAGDHVLQVVAQRIQRVAPFPAARLGGDEYVLLLHRVRPDLMSILADVLAGAIHLPGGTRVWVTASIGVGWGPDLYTALARADAAMYAAKRAGVPWLPYDPDLDGVAPSPDPRPAIRRRDLTQSLTLRGVTA